MNTSKPKSGSRGHKCELRKSYLIFRLISFLLFFSSCAKDFSLGKLDGIKPDVRGITVLGSAPFSNFSDTLQAECYTGEGTLEKFGFCISETRLSLEDQIKIWENSSLPPQSTPTIRLVYSTNSSRVDGKDYWRRFRAEDTFDWKIYWIVAFVSNENGTGYSEVYMHENCGRKFVYDIDNKKYPTLIIGNQCWTRTNLEVTRYQNGSTIIQIDSSRDWSTAQQGAWCYYNLNGQFNSMFGKLYNGFAVRDARGLCPTGWHVPSDLEWSTLSDLFGGNGQAGGSLKTTGTTSWNFPNSGATNLSGFSGQPGGYREGVSGSFFGLNYDGYWWSRTLLTSEDIWFRSLHYRHQAVDRYYDKMSNGFSVRCVRN